MPAGVIIQETTKMEGEGRQQLFLFQVIVNHVKSFNNVKQLRGCGGNMGD